MDRNFKIIVSSQSEEQFSAILADWRFANIEEHPQSGSFGRSYYPAVHGENHRDYSFAVEWQRAKKVVVLCSAVDGVLGMHGIPARIFAEENLDSDVFKLAIKQAFIHIDGIAANSQIHEVCISESAGPVLSPIALAALARGAKADLTLIGIVDLEAGPSAWKKSLRKSFQQLINWGRKNFTMSYVNRDNFSLLEFDRFRHFHAHVAGRVTRPIASWNAMADTIRDGRGELILAEIGGKLVASALFIDGSVTSLYMSAVYDREIKEPLAHYIVWNGMERAHARGMRKLELGPIYQPGTTDAKNYNIGFFKRGFVTHMETNLEWRWQVNAGENRQDVEAAD